jgi:precorrin-2 dehydrogenase/sirohydrochlorin ferrochelatase
MDSSSENEALEGISTPKHRLYPAFLVLEGKSCVVVGGGRVATRRVHSLLAAGARVVVVSASLHNDLQTLLERGLIDHIPENYAADYLTGASLVFATTNDPVVNVQIAHDARERGLLVNLADNPARSDFYVPATIYYQDLALAISTGGESPAFARYVRELLERFLSDALGQALALVAQARPLILALRLETVIETQGYAVAHHIFEKWLEQNMGSRHFYLHTHQLKQG